MSHFVAENKRATMIMGKKGFLAIIFFILCSIDLLAQTNYYYGEKKIPLSVNDNKICVSIPKNCKEFSEDVLKNINVIDKIKDNAYDIYVITKSDSIKLSTMKYLADDTILFSPSYITEDGAEVFSTPYINVRLKREQDTNILTSYAEKYGLKIIKKDSYLPLWYILSITPKCNLNAQECANALYESGKFAESIPDLCFNEWDNSNDPLFYQQWGLYNSNYTNIDISINPAWNYATGKNIKIAILDTGVDLNHLDLKPNISDMSLDVETDTAPSLCYDGHGTHCAGIAAAVKDNGIQIAGVAPEATIMSISKSFSASTNSQLKLADGIIWAYNHGADIISNSWHSTTYHYAIDEAIRSAFRYGRNGKGCVIVFSSGNDSNGEVNYPANCNEAILAVGAINNTGTRANFSNYGTKLDVVAPGVNVLSTLPNNQTGSMNGTSMACPHVAGIAALILERNSELTVNQVNSIINSNAKKISGVSFNKTKADGSWNDEYGYGLVDAYNSVINTPNVIYIQNESITGKRIFSADSISVGADVTENIEYGAVTLGQGNITLKANYVKLKNETFVPLGTKLKIGNQ